MTLPLLRQPPPPTTRRTRTVRADELASGDQLAIGDTVTGVDSDGTGVIYVCTEQYPTLVLPFTPAAAVRIYDQQQGEVGG